jgi:carboxyl-terminal processing protease
MRKTLLLLAALLVWVGTAAAPPALPKAAARTPAAKTGLTKEQRQKNLESFDLAWTTIRDHHFDPKLGGVNWQAVRDKLRPRVEKARGMDEARKVMQEMVSRLGHSHVGIFPGSLYKDLGKGPHQAGPGFRVRMVDGEAVVVRVSAGLPAARAGVRPGWRIRKIDGQELAPTLARIRKAVKKTPHMQAFQAYVVRSGLRGKEGKKVAVTFLDGSGKERTLSIPRARPRGQLVRQAGIYPVYVHFESRKVDKDITYFYLSDFLDPLRVMPAFADTVRKNLKAPGFILDLRGNGGGMIAMGIGLGGWFVDQPDLSLGTAIYRTGRTPYTLNPREVTYQGPLAILVDELSGSMSEMLAAGLQGLKRARVFGKQTTGSALPSRFLRLPNGDRLQYVIADYVSAGGKRVEGNGVQPDQVVPRDRRALLDGRDPTLEAAVKWIRSQRGKVQK